MQAAKKQIADQLLKKVEKALIDDTTALETLTGFLNAAANFMEKTQTIEVLETDEVADILKITVNHARTWSKHPQCPVTRIGASVKWPLHMLYQWLSVPQNYADLSKYKSA